MSEVHFEAPTNKADAEWIMGWNYRYKRWYLTQVHMCCALWDTNFTAWMEMPPAPVKPKRFVVDAYTMDSFQVKNEQGDSHARFIPTREAAQRIADIYEETAP